MHVHEALRQVREIRARVIEHQLFEGYSGFARMGGGCVALLGAWIMSLSIYPRTASAYVVAWGCICALACALNFGALTLWYFGCASAERRLEKLRPVLDAIAPLSVGAIFTFTLLSIQAYDLLYGAWMCLFGIVNIASRHALPQSIWYLGWCYIAAGTFYLLVDSWGGFLNPWPMALVFFIGEIAGGLIFISTKKDIL